MALFQWHSSVCMVFTLLNLSAIVLAKDSYCSLTEQQSILHISDDGNPALQCVMNFMNGMQDSMMINCGTKFCLKAVRSIEKKAPDCLQIGQKMTFNEAVQAFLKTCTESKYPKDDTSSSSSSNGTDTFVKEPNEGPICTKEEMLQIIKFGVGSPVLQCLQAFVRTIMHGGTTALSCGEKDCITAAQAIKDSAPDCIPIEMDFKSTFLYVVENFLKECDHIKPKHGVNHSSTSSYLFRAIVSSWSLMIMTIALCCNLQYLSECSIDVLGTGVT
jgi:hypothetical protein